MKIILATAIKAINNSAEFTYNDEDINTINWINGTQPIAKELILAKVAELQAEYEANQYQRDRANEYPSIVDQLDDLYHNGYDGWKATIQAIKNKYPKETN